MKSMKPNIRNLLLGYWKEMIRLTQEWIRSGLPKTQLCGFGAFVGFRSV